MRVALVHDWLTGLRGGEKCLQAFLEMYPDADIYTLLHVPGSTAAEIDERVRGTSFLQKFPGVRRYYRLLLPLYPRAADSIRLRGYDLVISLSHAAAKNVRVEKEAIHLCYCFTPMRYVWDQAQQYFRGGTTFLWPLIKYLRHWDEAGSHEVDGFAAISRFVAARIRCFYGRKASIIFPPVASDWISASAGGRGDAFLCAGALVPYKRIDLAIRACEELEQPLWIVGGGPEESRLRSLAGKHTQFFGRVEDQEFARFLRECKALLFPGTEDFGMIPLECMAAGRPVIARWSGGARETVNGLKPWSKSSLAAEAAAGVFFKGDSGADLRELREAIEQFLTVEDQFRSESCQAQAALFSPERFVSSWNEFVTSFGLPAVERSHVERQYA